ncbi:hypothetical protein [Micromonospora sp. CPCC 205556]|uniref:hypothetical protein n=1 Tax=Micromonospora sp. CPCC 205556 TaxID=3122398 RepID=UPI002FF0FA09
MSARIGDVYFDTCTLSNFAAVNRLDLLEERYDYRARWTETVRREVKRGVTSSPYLQQVLDATWLGEPLEIEGTTVALTEIDNIRRGLGGTSDKPLEHLGEAEIIYHIENVDPSGIFITDDYSALDFAVARGIVTIDTRRILEECHSLGEIGCPDAFRLMQDMQSHDRLVRVPASHMAVCPS